MNTGTVWHVKVAGQCCFHVIIMVQGGQLFFGSVPKASVEITRALVGIMSSGLDVPMH